MSARQSYRHAQPQFVILGFPEGDGVVVLASSTLTEGELISEYGYVDSWGIEPPIRMFDQDRHTLTVVMKDYVIARGATYAEAFGKLFGTWDPDARPELPGRKALS